MADLAIVDVRDLVDKAGNRTAAIRDKIAQGCTWLNQGRQTVVCCDYGISRSNAVAAGILAQFEQISLDTAICRVQVATGETEIKLEPLAAVRDALATERATTNEQAPILITGGGGFLGTAASARLCSEFQVIAPTRDALDLERGSLPLDLLVGEYNARMIVHLANPRVFTSNSAMGSTLIMLRNVIDVCVTRDIPLLYLSGWEVYSGYRGTLRADESLPPLPRGPYGETKYLCEVLIEHARATMGLRCGLLRSSPVYGNGGDKPKFICNFIEKARRGETIITHRYLNGDPGLDLLNVDDLVSAIVQAVRIEFTGTLNLGTGTVTSTRAIAEMLKELTGSSCRIEQTLIEADSACIAMDARRAAATLGWHPEITLAQGLSRLLSAVPQR
jgi:UDP-glucuronate decarboxylase